MDVTKYLALFTNDIIGSRACTNQNRLRLSFLFVFDSALQFYMTWIHVLDYKNVISK